MCVCVCVSVCVCVCEDVLSVCMNFFKQSPHIYIYVYICIYIYIYIYIYIRIIFNQINMYSQSIFNLLSNCFYQEYKFLLK